MSMADEYGGDSYGFDDNSMSTGQCCEQCVCDALDSGLAAIVDALGQINATLADKTQKNCDIVDQCQAEIINLIDQHFRGATKSCEECKADVAAGLGGSLEFAIACAGACIDETKQFQPCGSDNEGGICDTCGQSPCCCVDGECLPCGTQTPTPQVRHYYYAWCNYDTGQVFANRDDEPAPIGPGWASAGQYDDEDAAILAAKTNCQIPTDIGPPDYIPPPPTSAIFCGIDFWSEGGASSQVQEIADAWQGAKVANSIVKNIRALGVEGVNVGSAIDLIVAGYSLMAHTPIEFGEAYIPQLAAVLGGNQGSFVAGANVLGGIGVCDKMTGVDLSDFATSYVYAMNQSCPRKYISPDEATMAYLTGAIGLTEVNTIYAMYGYCPENSEWQIAAKMSRQSPAQLAEMRHRGIIDADTYAARMKINGYISTEWVSQIYAASMAIPSPPSLYHIHSQQADNDDVAAKYGLDDGFDSLWSGQDQQWLAGSGVTEQQARLEWRGHWTTPSLGSLFEFLHRLRDDQNFGGQQSIESEIDNAMYSLGIPSYWRKYYMATAFQPLLKRDINLAFTSGALATQDLLPALRQTGHDDTSISILSRELHAARRERIQSHPAIKQWTHQHINGQQCIQMLAQSGYDQSTITQAMTDIEYEFDHSSWAEAFARGTINQQSFSNLLSNWGISQAGVSAIVARVSYKIVDHPDIKNYTLGTVSQGTAYNNMTQDGIPSTVANNMLQQAYAATLNADTLECVRGYKRRYDSGELSNAELQNGLVKAGIDASRAGSMAIGIECQRASGGRPVAVEKLCHWLYIGAIDAGDFYNRLLRLGYQEPNASLILADCIQSNTIKQIKEANAVAKQIATEQSKAVAAVNKANAAIQRQNDKLAQMRKQKAQLRANRERQLVSSAEKVWKVLQGSLSDTLSATRTAVDAVQSKYGLTLDEALRIAIVAAENFDGKSLDDYGTLVDELSGAAAAAIPDPSDADIGVAPSSNGSTQPS